MTTPFKLAPTLTLDAKRRKAQAGGAIIEMVICTFVFVPLAFYSMWFCDTLHFGIKAQEASVGPVWDVTAKQIHSYTGGGGGKTKVQAAASKAQQQWTDLLQGFDSADASTTASSQSLLGRADSLKVTCNPTKNSGTGPGGEWTTNDGVSMMPTPTWVSCKAELQIHTVNMPKKYDQQRAETGVYLFPDDSGVDPLKMCGIGDGDRGCTVGASDGFAVLTDDWAVERGTENRLSIGSAGGNTAYWNVNNAVWSANDHGGTPAVFTFPIGGFGDQGDTNNFRLTYRHTSDGAFSPVESGHGQSNPYGGPSNTHTGGGWHEESETGHQDITKKVWDKRVTAHYLAVRGNPAD
jgi:hypothetical protein